MKILLPKIGTTEGGWSRVGWLRVDVHNGYESPTWYGLAYWHPTKAMAVCYPIPLNWVIWALREIYWMLKSTPHHYNHPLWKEGYEAGKATTENGYYYKYVLEKLDEQKKGK